MNNNIQQMVLDVCKQAKKASKELALADERAKNLALNEASKEIIKNKDKILAENKKDIKQAEEKGISPAMKDRLVLDDDRISAIANGLKQVAKLDDPVGKELGNWKGPSGIDITKISVPLGVLGIIYESRPNVTADAGGLSLKSGNACILRGGSESYFSSSAIIKCLKTGLEKANITKDAIQYIKTTNRQAVDVMLKMDDYINVIIPRGGKSLISKISENSSIPMFKHLQGICHIYVHHQANVDMATKVILNAKMRRTGLCNTVETILIDENAVDSHLCSILNELFQAGCEIKGDEKIQAKDERVKKASKEDWSTEYLAPILSFKTVKDYNEAINHIEKYSSSHTESIITQDIEVAKKFLQTVDSAIVMHNASTQFSDGGEFGMGAEIGISTGKLHARGPVGVGQLTSFKYLVKGNGNIRQN